MWWFISPSKGLLSLEQVCDSIVSYIKEEPNYKYKLIIGTDSYQREEVCFVTAIIVHRIGKGGVYYYRKKKEQIRYGLKKRIFMETSISLEIADKFQNYFTDQKIKFTSLEIHVDIGNCGETRTMIKEVTGMITGSGFAAKIKPSSYGASTVADRHTR